MHLNTITLLILNCDPTKITDIPGEFVLSCQSIKHPLFIYYLLLCILLYLFITLISVASIFIILRKTNLEFAELTFSVQEDEELASNTSLFEIFQCILCIMDLCLNFICTVNFLMLFFYLLPITLYSFMLCDR